MGKKILALVITCILLTGCGSSDTEVLANRETELRTEIAQLENYKASLEREIADIKVESETTKYVVTFNIKQSHFTLDIGQHLKDEMNDISIQIPVDKEYYDSVEVGDTIADDFRVGSLIMKGSFGNWDITVKDKDIQ